MMSYDLDQTGYDDCGICHLWDPAAKTIYVVKEAAMLENRYFFCAEPHHSRYGWVLFSKSIYDPFFFFFYSPFTNEVIELPKLEKRYSEYKATFSLSPKSPDCMVIALSNPEAGKLEIQTCKPDDKSWKT
ncbi:hypothetical protein EZV62_006897 [Acer yangbiense]|uniref:KIB1-4 beta-propeller domain-containing protein n=1 Tax=Acer yangbiense TaxID=1000413 RepID=A0A5C7IAA8_9ROSI|nr:hypothetical protein EZV62_006897 [Acer yangbiense]